MNGNIPQPIARYHAPRDLRVRNGVDSVAIQPPTAKQSPKCNSLPASGNTLLAAVRNVSESNMKIRHVGTARINGFQSELSSRVVPSRPIRQATVCNLRLCNAVHTHDQPSAMMYKYARNHKCMNPNKCD